MFSEDDNVENKKSFLVIVGSSNKLIVFAKNLVKKLHKIDIDIDANLSSLDGEVRTVRKQMQYADKNNYDYAVFLGEEEMQNGMLTIHNFSNQKQKNVSLNDLKEYLG